MRDKITAIAGTRRAPALGAAADGAHVSRPVSPRRGKQLVPGRRGKLARHPGAGRAGSAASAALSSALYGPPLRYAPNTALCRAA